ncbi:MAG TPA: DinB family protein [Pyrinomonadaceae bacterium]
MEFEINQAKAILRTTPATLRSLLEHLPEPWITANEGDNTWSPFDVLGHLIHGEETDWIPRARMTLNEGESRSFEPFDRFAMFGKSEGKTLADLLAAFDTARQTSLRELDNMQLTPELLEKRGRHPELGEVTLAQLLATWVVHDLDHIAQIVRVMSRQYKDAVGPWSAFLRVLQ